MDKRQLLKDAFDNKGVKRVPFGFWHHFVLGEDQFRGLAREEILERAFQGHLDYYKTTDPDMMKCMNEGFFGYPPVMESPLETGKDLRKIKSIGKDHPWITKQVAYVKRLVEAFGKEVMVFYNVFAPLQVIRIRLEFLDLDFSRFVYLAEHFPKEFHKAGMEIQKDIALLVEKLFLEAGLDGIYYCVQNIQSPMYTKELYRELIYPTEIGVLNRANALGDYNILHICGYAHHKNDLTYYLSYPAKVYNWATFTEHISLEEGKKLFGGKCVLGGFDNNPGTLIDTGSLSDLGDFARALLEKNAYAGYVMGADCSIPNDIDDRRIQAISRVVRGF